MTNQFYVSTTGSDANDGLTAATPFLTLNHATQVALTTPASGDVTYINLAAGVWYESVVVNGAPPGSANSTLSLGVTLIYRGAGTSFTTWNGGPGVGGTLIVNGGGDVGVQNMLMMGTNGPGQSILFAQEGGHIHVYPGMVFGATYQQRFHAENAGSQIQFWGNYSSQGSANNEIGVISGALVQHNNTDMVVTLNGTPTYTGAFIGASVGGIVNMNGTTWSGAIAGGQPAYNVSGNAVLNTSGRGGGSIPGTGSNVWAGGQVL